MSFFQQELKKMFSNQEYFGGNFSIFTFGGSTIDYVHIFIKMFLLIDKYNYHKYLFSPLVFMLYLLPLNSILFENILINFQLQYALLLIFFPKMSISNMFQKSRQFYQNISNLIRAGAY